MNILIKFFVKYFKKSIYKWEKVWYNIIVALGSVFGFTADYWDCKRIKYGGGKDDQKRSKKSDYR